MISNAIRFVLENLPAILFVAAIVVASVTRTPAAAAPRFLAWFLLLAIGVQGVWAGFFHVFFPHMAASSIGWQVSPFQFEIGVADFAIGITAIWSFWRSLEFKTAVVCYIVLFYIGVAVGHVRQAIAAGDFSPNNFGVLLLLTVVMIVLLPWLVIASRRVASKS